MTYGPLQADLNEDYGSHFGLNLELHYLKNYSGKNKRERLLKLALRTLQMQEKIKLM